MDIMLKFYQKKIYLNPQGQQIFEWLTANPLSKSVPWVLVFLLEYFAGRHLRSRASLSGCLHPPKVHLPEPLLYSLHMRNPTSGWMRGTSVGKPAPRRITQHSTIDHSNIQLGGGASPVYLAKYFFPLVLLFLSLLYFS